MYSWAWSTTWIMSIALPLCRLSDALLHGQSGFKWHFGLWALYGHIQQWRHTRNGGNAILIQASGLIEHYLLSELKMSIKMKTHLVWSKPWQKSPLKSSMHLIHYWSHWRDIAYVIYYYILPFILNLHGYACWYITLYYLVKAICWNTKLISEHSAFPLVIVWVWQWGAWKHATM